MKVGLIDVDGHHFPNLVLMKLSSWHKQNGDEVSWYEPMFSGHMDVVYMSKVFSSSSDYAYYVDADKIIKGGSGYCISLKDGKEVFDRSKDICLPNEIEHTFPDYGLYSIDDTAYGFLTRGCPRGCDFCIVGKKEGRTSIKVANLNEFWDGQKNVVLLDPNILACKDWKELLQQLIDSKAYVDFNQGVDIRFMTHEKAEMLSSIKMKELHFAWDRYQDKQVILPRFEEFRKLSHIHPSKLIVYVLCNYDTTIDQDLERIYMLRNMGYLPYVMLYNKSSLPRGHKLRQLQRWCNNRIIFQSCDRFEQYRS